jgi:hypothetical protein
VPQPDHHRLFNRFKPLHAPVYEKASSAEFVGGSCSECSESLGFSRLLHGSRNQRK